MRLCECALAYLLLLVTAHMLFSVSLCANVHERADTNVYMHVMINVRDFAYEHVCACVRACVRECVRACVRQCLHLFEPV